MLTRSWGVKEGGCNNLHSVPCLYRSLDVGAVVVTKDFTSEDRLPVLWGAPTTTCRLLILHLGASHSTDSPLGAMNGGAKLTLKQNASNANKDIADTAIKGGMNTTRNKALNSTPNDSSAKKPPTTTSDINQLKRDRTASGPVVTSAVTAVLR